MPKRHCPGHASRRQLENALIKIDELTKGKGWVEARDQLLELDRRFPNNGEMMRLSRPNVLQRLSR